MQELDSAATIQCVHAFNDVADPGRGGLAGLKGADGAEPGCLNGDEGNRSG